MQQTKIDHQECHKRLIHVDNKTFAPAASLAIRYAGHITMPAKHTVANSSGSGDYQQFSKHPKKTCFVAYITWLPIDLLTSTP
jgi:hypothetical protein